MNKLTKTLNFLTLIALSIAVFSAQAGMAEREGPTSPNPITYQALLGKPLNDQVGSEFLASNSCSQAGSFQLCPLVGLAFWTNKDQIIKTAYLYSDDVAGFSAYEDALPFKLSFEDTMNEVELKLGQPRMVLPELFTRWERGLPDEGAAPDHLHYQAVYKRFGLTIVYNSPSAEDKGATIHSILVTK